MKRYISASICFMNVLVVIYTMAFKNPGNYTPIGPRCSQVSFLFFAHLDGGIRSFYRFQTTGTMLITLLVRRRRLGNICKLVEKKKKKNVPINWKTVDDDENSMFSSFHVNSCQINRHNFQLPERDCSRIHANMYILRKCITYNSHTGARKNRIFYYA